MLRIGGVAVFSTLIFVVGPAAGWSPPALAYTYRNAVTRQLAEKLDTHLDLLEELQAKRLPADLDHLLSVGEGIESVEADFARIDRSTVDMNDLLELKYRLMHWRVRAAGTLVALLPSLPDDGRFRLGLSAFRSLRTTLKPREARALLKNTARSRRGPLIALIASTGDRDLMEELVEESLIEAGELVTLGPSPVPNATLDLVPDLPSDEPRAADWWTDPAFSQYHFDETGQGFYYRGLHLKAGDLIVTHENKIGDGIHTSITQPTPYIAHAGMVVMMEGQGFRSPAIVEIYQNGVRAVPAHLFFLPRFGSYVEFFRFKDPDTSWTANLSAAAKQLIHQPVGYNLGDDSNYPRYLTCTTTLTRLLELAGGPRIAGRSQLGPTAQANLRSVGIYIKDVLTPTDFVRSSQMEYVGAIDNRNLELAITGNLVARRFGALFNRDFLQPRRAGTWIPVFEMAVRHIQRRTAVIAPLMLWIGDISYDNFPAGNSSVLAFYPYLSEGTEEAIHALREELGPMIRGLRTFSFHDFESDTYVASQISKAMEEVTSWFKPREEVIIRKVVYSPAYLKMNPLIRAIWEDSSSQDPENPGRDRAMRLIRETLATGRWEQVRQLVNTPDDNGYTPLMAAVQTGNEEVVRVLLELRQPDGEPLVDLSYSHPVRRQTALDVARVTTLGKVFIERLEAEVEAR